MKLTFAVLLLLTATVCWGQIPAEAPAAPADKSQAQAAAPQTSATITIPPGTELLLSLVRPVSTRTTNVGDKVYLQTSIPVVVAGIMAIPTGTSVVGTLDKAPHAQLRQRRAQFRLRLASLIFANGYTVSIPGTLDVTTNLGESTSTYGDAGNAAPIAAAAGSGGGLAIGAAAGGVRGAAIGGIIGGVGGMVAALILAAHHGGVFMDVGTPVNAVFETPLTVEHDRVLDAASHYPAPAAIRPAPRHMCYDPGSPGTPATVISGTPATPGTPDTVIPGPNGTSTVIPGTPGTPGTPDTVIPGTPATPGRYYPCPPH